MISLLISVGITIVLWTTYRLGYATGRADVLQSLETVRVPPEQPKCPETCHWSKPGDKEHRCIRPLNHDGKCVYFCTGGPPHGKG